MLQLVSTCCTSVHCVQHATINYVLLLRCEDQSSLGLFFSIFVPYVRCIADRRKAFIDIRQKFPESIDWSDGVGGTLVKISPPNKGYISKILVVANLRCFGKRLV